jgi:polysaccharide biosynthesis protein PslH
LKVLWLTRENPLFADRGDLMYSGGLIRSLAAAGAAVTVLSFNHEGSQPPAVDRVRSLSARPPRLPRAFSILTDLPADAFRHKSGDYQSLMEQELRTGAYDAVVIDYFAMGWVVKAIERVRRKLTIKPVVVYTSHHFEQVVRPFVAKSYNGGGLAKLVLPYDAAKGAALEATIVSVADVITTITESDRADFLRFSPGKSVYTLTPGYSGPVDAGRWIDDERPHRVLLVGAFDWIAKRQNLREFVLAAKDRFGRNGIELQIVGRADEGFKSEIESIYPGCKFIGRVESVYSYIHQARIGLMPDVIGGGFKLKFLDYIFNGLPIATIRSQARGLPLDLDSDLIADDDLEQLVDRIVSTIGDVSILNGMRERAFAACEDKFDWRDRGLSLFAAIKQHQRSA